MKVVIHPYAQNVNRPSINDYDNVLNIKNTKEKKEISLPLPRTYIA